MQGTTVDYYCGLLTTDKPVGAIKQINQEVNDKHFDWDYWYTAEVRGKYFSKVNENAFLSWGVQQSSCYVQFDENLITTFSSECIWISLTFYYFNGVQSDREGKVKDL